MKDYTEDTVKNMHLDLAKVISGYSGLTVDQVGTFYVALNGSWDSTINVLYIMMEKKMEFKEAVYLYKEHIKRKLASKGRRIRP